MLALNYLLNSFNYAFLFLQIVTIPTKAKIVKKVIEDKEEAQNKYPAAKVNPTSGNLTWFLDGYAGRELKEAKK